MIADRDSSSDASIRMSLSEELKKSSMFISSLLGSPRLAGGEVHDGGLRGGLSKSNDSSSDEEMPDMSKSIGRHDDCGLLLTGVEVKRGIQLSHLINLTEHCLMRDFISLGFGINQFRYFTRADRADLLSASIIRRS